MSGRNWKRILRVPRPIRRQAREDIETEIAFHIDARTDELVARGMSPGAARERAEREFGDRGAARAALERPARRRERRRRMGTVLAETVGDLRYGARGLRANPAYAAVAILTLGLAIAANASISSLLSAVLLQPLPYEAPGRLAMVWRGPPDERERPDYLTVAAWRDRARAFEDMAIVDPVTMTLADARGAGRIGVARASPDLLPLLGVSPIRGRPFTPDEATGRRAVALIGHDFWQRQFAGSEDALGATLALDGRPTRIIGVLPRDFEFPGIEADVWEPHTLFPDWETTGNEGSWYVVGRLRPGATIDGARREMEAIEAALDPTRPASERSRGVTVVPLGEYAVGPVLRLALWALTGATACVLLIAAANVTGLSLARGVGRTREFAVRASLGASPTRLGRQVLAESVTLALAGGLLGTGLALGGIRLLRLFGPDDLPRLEEAGLDPAVLGWTLALTLAAGLLIGLAPAATVARRRLPLPGAIGARGGTPGTGVRGLRRGLVVGELAVAIVLLAGAGLLVRSWVSLARVDPGFAPEGVLSVNLSTSAFPSDATRLDFYRDVLERVGAVPGVARAGMIGDLFTDGDATVELTTDGSAGAPVRLALRADEVSADLFATLRTPLLRGRAFTADDGPGAPPVAIVNDAMAARLFPGRDAVGRRFRPAGAASEAPWITVVGVVADMRRRGLERPPIPQVFFPLAQQPSASETLLVRVSAGDPMRLAGAVEAAVRAVDAGVPLYFVTTLEARMAEDLARRRFQTALLVAFSLVALLMAAIGVYGLLHYSVAARRRELAVRVTVGARPRDILRLTLGEGLRLTGIGLLIGLVGALAVGRAGSRLLFGVTPTDPLTYGLVALLLLAVAGTACWLPARRALRVDPAVALRPE